MAKRKSRRLRSEELELSDLANVGPATLRDFDLLRIQTVRELAGKEAFSLYRDLCRRTKQRHDPCVIDVFLATIAQAKGGAPRSWWKFTAERKARLARSPELSEWQLSE